jgi:hypothetical protein
MGCSSSKESALSHVDDSVHVMIAHDKKRAKQKGQEPHGYVPRAPHPLLHNQNGDGATGEGEKPTGGTTQDSKTS